jgi:hypothetical protein
VNKSCLGNETLEIPYQRPKFLKLSGGGGGLDCVRGWCLTHADHSTLAAMEVNVWSLSEGKQKGVTVQLCSSRKCTQSYL